MKEIIKMLSYINLFIDFFSKINFVSKDDENEDIIKMLKREYKDDWEYAYFQLKEKQKI